MGQLFQRAENNPILTAADLPYGANAVFNPGAARVGEETILLLRVEDMRGISHLQVARSLDGMTAWCFDAEPLLRPHEQHPEEVGAARTRASRGWRTAGSGSSRTPRSAVADRSCLWP
jgi:predicted GH43/DUF377 family glycosyl hydrolase